MNTQNMVQEGVACISRTNYKDSPYLMYDAGKVTCKLEHSGQKISLAKARELLRYVEMECRAEGMEHFVTVFAHGAMHLFYSRYNNFEVIV